MTNSVPQEKGTPAKAAGVQSKAKNNTRVAPPRAYAAPTKA